jgi:hypothetical protein
MDAYLYLVRDADAGGAKGEVFQLIVGC